MIFDKVHLLFRIRIWIHNLKLRIQIRIQILQKVSDSYGSRFGSGSTLKHEPTEPVPDRVKTLAPPKWSGSLGLWLCNTDSFTAKYEKGKHTKFKQSRMYRYLNNMFKTGKTSLGQCCHFTSMAKFYNRGWIIHPWKYGHVVASFGWDVISHDCIVQGADRPRNATLRKNGDLMSHGHIVQGRIVHIPFFVSLYTGISSEK
jgi:hypothetical protein